MIDIFDLNRFLQAQESTYPYALRELKEGYKRSHWMWYIFPQMRGLGHSRMSNYYGISGLEETKAYLENPILNQRLREVCEAILGLDTNDAREVFGGIDSLKLKSSMTLFDLASPDNIFAKVLDKFFDGKRCEKTLAMSNQ
ncbi:MAG: DUF1810 domain-containing protein [Muribaculaceae bacterium]|nr:DUF1810 domain-containing protein [Muribaculaceae bacterium]